MLRETKMRQNNLVKKVDKQNEEFQFSAVFNKKFYFDQLPNLTQKPQTTMELEISKNNWIE